MGWFYQFCPCQVLHLSLTEEDIKCSSKKRELDELRRRYVQEKGFTVLKMWECKWWRLSKTTTNIKLQVRENFLYRRSLTEHQLLGGIMKEKLFGYVQGDNGVPINFGANSDNFPLTFKNTLVRKNDIGDLMKTYAEEEGIMSQPRKLLMTSFTLQKRTPVTPLLLYYLQLGFVFTKIHHVVEYTPTLQ